MKSFPQEDTSARQWVLEISFSSHRRAAKGYEVSPAHLQDILLKTRLHKWSWPMTKSLGPIVVTTILVSFPGERLGSTTGGFACNSPVPKVCTMVVEKSANIRGEYICGPTFIGYNKTTYIIQIKWLKC